MINLKVCELLASDIFALWNKISVLGRKERERKGRKKEEKKEEKEGKEDNNIKKKINQKNTSDYGDYFLNIDKLL